MFECAGQIRRSICSVDGIELPEGKAISDFIGELRVFIKKISVSKKEFELVSAIGR